MPNPDDGLAAMQAFATEVAEINAPILEQLLENPIIEEND